MPFYHYRQNNSWGHFENDADKGICENVIVEAADAKAANEKAKEIGLYFDGVYMERDCDCCGDRWDPAVDSDGTENPQIYGCPINTKKRTYFDKGCCVHYLTGGFKFFEFPYAQRRSDRAGRFLKKPL